MVPMQMTIQFFPKPGQDYDDPGFEEITRTTADEIVSRFGNVLTNREINPPPFGNPKNTYVNIMTGHVRRVSDAEEVHSWLAANIFSILPKSRTSLEGSHDPSAIVVARWVELKSDWRHAEKEKDSDPPLNARPVICKKCGWQDLSVTPNPLTVAPQAVSKGGREIFPACNGVVVVAERIHDILLSLAKDDFESGKTVFKDGSPNPALFWIRPVHHIGGYTRRVSEGAICDACGRPERLATYALCRDHPVGFIVDDFGEPQWNMALVGQDATHAGPAVFKSIGPLHDLVISGGLFAALWNHKVKGLKWPEHGPYMSRRDNEEPTWEEKRRYSDLFKGSKDRVLKAKVR